MQNLKKSLSIATLIIAASDVLSRLLGFIRVQLLAYYGGTGAAVDAYSFSFILPDFINHLLAGSALSVTFIPLFQHLIHREDEKKAWQFFWNLLICGTAVFLLFIGAGLLFTEEIVALAGKNINDPNRPDQFALTVHLTRIILPAQLFFFWGALLNGIQYAKRQFLVPALTPVFYNLGIICGGWLLFPRIGIDGFSWGVLIGAFAGNVLIQIFGARRAGIRFHPVVNLKDATVRKYVLLTLPFIVGLSMTFSNEFLFRIFGSFLRDGTGALASLDYSYKLMFIFVGIFGHSFAAGFYPFISQLMIEKKYAEIQRITHTVLVKIGTFLIPLCACMIVLAPFIIALLFQRGEFTAESTRRTAATFAYYLPGAFFCAAILFINRLFYAAQNTLLPMLVSTGIVVAGLPLYYFLGKVMGAGGIALASSITMILQSIFMYGAWSKRHPNPYLKSTLHKFGAIAAVSTAGAALCWGISRYLTGHFPGISSTVWNSLFVCGIAGCVSYLFMMFLLELCKVQNIRAPIRSYLKKIKT